MRKLCLFSVIFILIGMASCSGLPRVATVPNHVTKKATFDEVNHSVQSRMESLGFQYLGYENTLPGFQKAIVQESIARYSFMDSLGNTMNFSIALYPRKNLVHIELCECETSNPNDYERLCGNDGVVKRILEEQKLKKYQRTNLYREKGYDSVVSSVQSHMRSQGFELTKCDPISYDPRNRTVNRPTRQDNYRFVNDFGNTVRFSFSYNKSINKKGVVINDVELCGCEPGNPNDYERFCGDDGVIKQLLKNPNYYEAVSSARSFMESQGFKTIGFGSVWDKRFADLHQNTYHFIDSLGNKMSYSVYYAMWVDKKGDYVYYSELCGCETSNPNDFERLCGDEGVLGKIKELPKDQDITGKKIAQGALGVGASVGYLILEALGAALIVLPLVLLTIK